MRLLFSLETVTRNTRQALRGLRRNSIFTATALLTLAVGVGANTAAFSVVNSILIKPLNYPDADRLVGVWNTAPGAPGLASVSGDLPLSPSMYFTFAEQNRVFQSLGVWTPGQATVTGIAEPQRPTAAFISDGLLQALETSPALGRWLTGEDQAPHGPNRVLLGYGYWQRNFGGDRLIVGRGINVNSRSTEIVGVMPQGFKIRDFTPDLILPLKFDRSTIGLSAFSYGGIARLKPGITIARANADMARLLPIWQRSWPSSALSRYYLENWRITPAVRLLKRDVVGNVGDVLWIVMGTIGLVQLIACANVANLWLIRAEARQHELAIRAALGAGWDRIVRELLWESLSLSLLGGGLGVGLAYCALALLVAHGPANLPRLSEVSLDTAALVFSLAISVASGLFFGLLPAFKYGRPFISKALGSSRIAGASRSHRHTQEMLVVGQIAFALVLLICASLMLRTFASVRSVAPGFAHPEQIQSARIALPAALSLNPDATVQVQRQILDKLAAIPGASSVAFSVNLPMEGMDDDWDEMFAEGKNDASGQNPVRMFKFISPGFFGAMGTKFVSGRDYTWTDVEQIRPVVIISTNYAQELWGSAAAAIGKRIRTGTGTPWREIIGVVEDVRNNGLQERAPAIVYWPSRIDKLYPSAGSYALRSLTLVLRSSRAGTAPFANEIRQAVWSLNPNLPVTAMRTMREIYDGSLARTSFTMVMLALAGTMALFLGVVGIYGVIAYAVSQRRREIGIRIALGAQQRGLKTMFVRDGAVLTSIGILIGLVLSTALTRLMKAILFGINPIDPLTYVAVPVFLLVAAILASYIPAVRAARIDPLEALKAE